MPPNGVAMPQQPINSDTEGLVRRGRRKAQAYFTDQITGKLRPPISVFEPRLPQTRPKATKWDKYLSVNICSSLRAAGLPVDWNSNSHEFYGVLLTVGSCKELGLSVTWEPIEDLSKPHEINPHHGGIQGVVELYHADIDHYERTISGLARASEVLPECVPE